MLLKMEKIGSIYNMSVLLDIKYWPKKIDTYGLLVDTEVTSISPVIDHCHKSSFVLTYHFVLGTFSVIHTLTNKIHLRGILKLFASLPRQDRLGK